MTLPILSLIICIPLLAALVLASGKLKGYAQQISLGASLIQIGLLIKLALGYQTSTATFQWVEQHDWIHFSLGSLGQFVAKYHLGIDGLSFGLIILTGIISSIAIWNSDSIKEKTSSYFALIMLLNASLMGCFLAKDFLLFYLFFEFMLLPMYFLIGIWGGPRKEYASIKFFIYTLAGSLFILLALLALGTSYIDPYETALAIDFIQPGQAFSAENAQMIQTAIANGEIASDKWVHSFDAAVFADLKNCYYKSILHPDSAWVLGNLSAREWAFWLLFIGFGIKLPIVPFHTWLPDAHVEAPTPVSVLLAGVLLKIGAYGWLRFTLPFFPKEALEFSNILSGIGAISIIYGAFNALAMTDLKKLVAYSSISHMGFVLLGIASFTAEGWQGAIFQLISHGVLSSLLFLLVGVIYDRTHDRSIQNYSGLAQIMPAYTFITGLAFFASLGLPGFSGFIGEFFSLMGSFNSQHSSAIWAILGGLGIILGAGYFLWTFQKMFLGKQYLKNSEWLLSDLTRKEKLSLYFLGISSLLLGIFPSIIFNLTDNWVSHLINQLF
ncbi:NADH-quinone oxidoreductase subunit M [Sandaracinomonas limnophila]|uniref:NADH-quinone oxidoreductase subunit M n=1 Tax=Sandaracinomonas limnophila TaxID=1862386 RepID=A0A437PTQ7_9BACT|nr:NADH-quinone oxidoreductase subunit M [Sandaracinomonas limnophila]RVU25641.1 NADH-quinone oxidoreductase subunit M [Sandaracinomonas limnophila]